MIRIIGHLVLQIWDSSVSRDNVVPFPKPLPAVWVVGESKNQKGFLRAKRKESAAALQAPGAPAPKIREGDSHDNICCHIKWQTF